METRAAKAVELPLKTRRLLPLIVNGIMFNISWLLIVVNESTPIALAVVAMHVLLHCAFFLRGAAELGVLLIVSVAGFALDQLLFGAGLFLVAGEASAAPLWLSCLWPVFATTLCHAFSIFYGRYVTAAILGAVSGTASYIAGTGLTAVDFSQPMLSPAVLAALWACLFPLALALANYLVPEQGRTKSP